MRCEGEGVSQRGAGKPIVLCFVRPMDTVSRRLTTAPPAFPPICISRSHPAQVPEGATPRTISIHLRGEVCRSMKPGDVVILSGIFLPEPVQGFRAMRAGLLTTTYILVCGCGVDSGLVEE